MKHTKKRLHLKTEMLRNLTEQEMAHVAGGVFTEFTSCLPTQFNTCHIKTPACPM